MSKTYSTRPACTWGPFFRLVPSQLGLACALLWLLALFGSAAWAQSEEALTLPPACTSTGSAARQGGFFGDLQRPNSQWYVEYDAAREVASFTWMTHVGGKPTWFFTKPQLIASLNNGFVTQLYKPVRSVTDTPQAGGLQVGEVAIRWAPAGNNSIAFRWLFSDPAIAPATVQTTCLYRRSGEFDPASSKDGLGRWHAGTQATQVLKNDHAIFVGLNEITKKSTDVRVVSAMFDSADQPVWLMATTNIGESFWPTAPLALMYNAGALQPEDTGTCASCPAPTNAGTVLLSTPGTMTPHRVSVPATGSGPALMPTGQSLQWRTTAQSGYQRLDHTSWLKVEVVPGTGAGEGCKTWTADQNSLGLYTDKSTTVRWGAKTCKLKLTWSMPAGSKLYRMGNLELPVELRQPGGAALPATSDLMPGTDKFVIDDLSPTGIGDPTLASGAETRADWASFNYAVATDSVDVWRQTTARTGYFTINDRLDVQADSAHPKWTKPLLDAFSAPSPPINTRCGPGWAADVQEPVLPGRWSSGPVGSGSLNDYSGLYWDLETRGTGATSMWRATWYTYNAQSQPVWLQTSWMPIGPPPTYVRRGFLRRYDWNPVSQMRTAGVPVGMVTVLPLSQAGTAGSAPKRGLLVHWRWDEPGATGSTPPDDYECLRETYEPALRAPAPDAASPAYNGMWAGRSARQLRAVDSMSISASASSGATPAHSENHLLQLWTATNAPVWLKATASWSGAVGSVVPFNEMGTTLAQVPNPRTLYIRSPFSGGVPTTPRIHLTSDLCEVPLLNSDGTAVFARSLALPNQPWYEGELSIRAINLTPGCTGAPVLNWRFPESIFESSPTGLVRSENLAGYTTLTRRIQIYPYDCQATSGSPCKFNISWTSNFAESVRLERVNLQTDQRQVLPAGGAAFASTGEYTDAVSAIGRYCYYLLDPQGQRTGDQVCPYVWSNEAAPPAFGGGCVKVVGALPSTTTACLFSTALSTSVAPGTDVVLTFDEISPAISHYLIQETPQCGRALQVPRQTSVSRQVLQFKACENPPGGHQTYTYKVATCSSFNVCGTTVAGVNEPAYSTSFATLTVSGAAAVPTPTAADLGNGRFKLTWEASSTPSGSYYQYAYSEGTAGNATSPQVVVTAPAASGIEGSIEGSGTYYFRIRLCSGLPATCPATWSAPSNAVVLTRAPLPPTVIPGTNLDYTLSWSYSWGTPVGFFKTGYSSLATGAPTTVSTGTAATSTSATMPLAGTYYFRVQACSIALHCSDWSEPGGPITLPSVDQPGALPTVEAPSADLPPTSGEVAASSRVGASGGELRVNEGGALNYSIAIQTAPGRGNLAPSLSLNYSGSSGVGVAGPGWNLGGVSSIGRCLKSIEAGDGPGPHPAVNFDDNDSNDAYCLDGQRLLPVSGGTGSEAIDGRVYPYWEFRTEIESFQRVRAYLSPADASGGELVHGPLFWRVVGKDGMTEDFGRDYAAVSKSGRPAFATQSAFYANLSGMRDHTSTSYQTEIPPSDRLVAGRYAIISWSLSRTQDRVGNSLLYRYEREQVAGAPLAHRWQYLGGVFYTAHETGSGFANPYAAVMFSYSSANAPHSVRAYSNGHESMFPWRLDQIHSCIRAQPATLVSGAEYTQPCDPATAAGANRLLRTYKLSYDRATESLPAGVMTSGQRRLVSTQECGYHAGVQECFAPTTFDWYAGNVEYAPQFNPNGPHLTGLFKKLAGYKAADLNGDGRNELVYRQRLTNLEDAGGLDKIWVVHASGQGAATTLARNSNYIRVSDTIDNMTDGRDPERSWHVMDVNGDGLDDLLLPYPNLGAPGGSGDIETGFWHWVAYYSNGSEFVSTPVALYSTGTENTTQQWISGDVKISQLALTDTDGDGIVDMLYPQTVGTGTPTDPTRSALVVRKGSRNAAGLLTFAGSHTVVQIDFHDTNCYDISLGRGRPDRWSSYDVNADSRADLVLRFRSCIDTPNNRPVDGYRYEGDQIFTNQRGNSINYGGVFVSRGLAQFERITGNFAALANTDNALQMQDLNGDGLADLVMHNDIGPWTYALNLGADAYSVTNEWFSTPRCLIPVAGGSSGTCLPVLSSKPVEFQDYNGDGRVDLLVGHEGTDQSQFMVHPWTDILSCNGASTGPTACSHFGPGTLTSLFSGRDAGDWSHMMLDLDADGYPENIGYRGGLDSSSGRFLQSLKPHLDGVGQPVADPMYGPGIPRDLIHSVTSGFGARTRVEHASMADSSVYTADKGALQLFPAGRGSKIVDVIAPMYVVRRLRTPTELAAPNDMAVMNYRYQGMRMQLGGRGSLGFNKVYSLNAQNGIETTTWYSQQFPLIGRAGSTMTKLLQPQYLELWRTTKLPRCPAIGCYFLDVANASSKTLSQHIDQNTFLTRAPGNGEFDSQQGSSFPPTGAVVSFPYTSSSTAYSHDPDTGVRLASISTVYQAGQGLPHPFDRFGNALRSVQETSHGSTTLTLDRRTTGVNTYEAPDLDKWIIGKLQSSVVTHERPGLPPVVRTVAFTYDSNGQLSTETVEPLQQDFFLRTVHGYNAYGLETRATVCNAFAMNQLGGSCPETWSAANALAVTPFDVYRHKETVYADGLRLRDGTFVPIAGLALASGEKVPRYTATGLMPDLQSTGSTYYSLFGSPVEQVPTVGARSLSTYDAFGRAVHQYSPSTGARSTSLLANCGPGGVSCPDGAKTRVAERAGGSSTSYTYSDRLGRTVMSLSPSFISGQFHYTRSWFDILGRQVKQSEPALTADPGPGTVNVDTMSFKGLNGAYSSESCYDAVGRVIKLKQPNHQDPAWTCATNYTPAAVTSTTPDTANIIYTDYDGLQTQTINGLGQATTVLKNVLGETVTSLDSNGVLSEFSYDTMGNMVKVRQLNGATVLSETTASYDDMGRKTGMTDPDAGQQWMAYNAAGEVLRVGDAEQHCSETSRDANGRSVKLVEYNNFNAFNKTCYNPTGDETRFRYDGAMLGALDEASYGPAGQPHTRLYYQYDSVGRGASLKRCILPQAMQRTQCHVEKGRFDRFGRADWMADASSEKLVEGAGAPQAGELYRGTRMHYSDGSTVVSIPSLGNRTISAGFQYKLTELAVPSGQPAKVYYEVLGVSPRGQITQERIGGSSNLMTTRTYQPDTGRVSAIDSGVVPNKLQALSLEYDELGNLRRRLDQSEGRSLDERFPDSGGYDSMNRILRSELTVTPAGQASQLSVMTMSYSQGGNLLAKDSVSGSAYLQSEVLGYSYGNADGQHGADCLAGGPHAVGSTTTMRYCHDRNGNQVRSINLANSTTSRLIAYSVFSKPIRIESFGDSTNGTGHATVYRYGPARETVSRLDIPGIGQPDSAAGLEVHYLGNVELEMRRGASSNQFLLKYKRYVGGVAIITDERTVTVAGTTETSAFTNRSYEYLFKDHLGSTHVIANNIGGGRQYYGFDVWGLRRDASSASTLSLGAAFAAYNPLSPTIRTREGYTGHEQVEGAGIIHMGGRIYDPLLGRFLQADPIVQDPLNAQSYNRYTYVFNNPLSLTDPSGYRSLSANVEMYWKPALAVAIAIYTGGQSLAALQAAGTANAVGGVASGLAAVGVPGAGAVAAGAANVAAASINSAAMWATAGGAAAGLVTTGSVKGAVIGAVQGGATFGIGQAYHAGKVVEGIAGHALLGGILEGLNGGDFGHGFRVAGISKIMGIGVDAIPVPDSAKVVVQSIVGGTVSRLDGGKFATGAVTAALQFAYNAMQEFQCDGIGCQKQRAHNGSFGIDLKAAALFLIPGVDLYNCMTAGCSGGEWVLAGVDAFPGWGKVSKIARFRKLDNVIDVVEACCCFPAGTPVLTDHGHVAIEKIAVGDQVLSRDSKTGLNGLKRVARLFVTASKPIYILHYRDVFGGNSAIAVTGNHPFWTKDDGWLEVRKLKPLMELQDADGKSLVVTRIELAGSSARTYNLEVEDFHTYFVGPDEVLVHNVCACASRINESRRLVREAEFAGRIDQEGLDHLVERLSMGDLNPGLGSSSLGRGISYARARGGARVFFRQTKDGVEILGKAVKPNEDAVIKEVLKTFGGGK